MTSSQFALDERKDGEVSTEQLVDLAARGCADSFAQLAELFRPRLLQALESRIGEGTALADAEDIVQDALGKAYCNLSQYNPQFKFSTWLYTIAFSVANDYYRKQKRWFTFLAKSTVRDSSRSDETTWALDRRDQVNNIWLVARSLLNADQYTAFWLRFGENMSIHEIAQIVGRSEGNVRVSLHRGRLLMIEHFKENDGLGVQVSNKSRLEAAP